MQIEHEDMQAAIQAGLITSTQAEQLWSLWQKDRENIPQFRLSHVLYYFGGMLAISAVTLFVTQAWEQIHGLPLLLLTTLLFVLGLLLTQHFSDKKLPIPAGILATFSLALVPLIVYNLQIWLGYLPGQNYDYSSFHFTIDMYWVPMELSTLIVGVLLFYVYRFPFLLFLIAVTLWYLSMDLFSLIFHTTDISWRAMFSIYFGLLTLFAAIYVDFKYSNKQHDYAFWLYIFGVLTFWGGISYQLLGTEINQLIYCFINLVMIFVSVVLNRRVFAIFGALGILSYLAHLSLSFFANSLLFPISLIFLGLIIIFAAAKWPHMERKLVAYFRPFIVEKIFKKMQD